MVKGEGQRMKGEEGGGTYGAIVVNKSDNFPTFSYSSSNHITIGTLFVRHAS